MDDGHCAGTLLRRTAPTPETRPRPRRFGGPGQQLPAADVTEFVTRALGEADLDDKTGQAGSFPTPPAPARCRCCCAQAGTPSPDGPAASPWSSPSAPHQGMDEAHLAQHLGYQVGELDQTYPGWTILNHESWLPETFTSLGTIGADRLTRADRRPDDRHQRRGPDQPAHRRRRGGDRGWPGVPAPR